MATEIYLPRLGESIEEATISCYVKKVGDILKRGDVIAELETAKAMMELESPVKGVLLALFPEVGETINRGTMVAIVGDPGEDWQESLASKEEKDQLKEKTNKLNQGRINQKLRNEFDQPRVMISPNAKRVAKTHNLSLNSLRDAFPRKRITSKDVLTYVNEETKPGRSELTTEQISLSTKQRLTAEKMMISATEIPQFSVSVEINAEGLIQRKQECVSNGQDCSYTALIIQAVAFGLKKHRRLNGCFKNGDFFRYDQINLAIAMALPDGLVAPVIHNADKLETSQIVLRLNDLKKKAQENALTSEDVEHATFTISNLGMMNVRAFTPMVVPQQAGILGIGEMYPVVKINDNQEPIQQICIQFTLSADHRVVGGMECADFLKTFKNTIDQKQGE